MGLIAVLTALPARLATVPFSGLSAHWTVAANLLSGSLLGARAGASWAMRMHTHTTESGTLYLGIPVPAPTLQTREPTRRLNLSARTR
jgi:hypothetical protein